MFFKLLKNIQTGKNTVAVKQNDVFIPLLPLFEHDNAFEKKCILSQEKLCDMVLFLKDWQLAVTETEYLLELNGHVNIDTGKYQDRQLPFTPLSYRDFMLYEQHVIDAGKGFMREFMPAKVNRILCAYEKIFHKPFPKIKPKKLWYQKPIYYMGNHLSILPDESEIIWPSYSNYIDYELELGVLITKRLFNSSPKEAKEAIGGFVVFNDLSARDKQLSEMDSGFGPVKSKNFASVMGQVVATPDEILPHLKKLEARIYINEVLSGTGKLSGSKYSYEEAISYASLGEYIYPGEFIAGGTVPGCSGIESNHHVNHGDIIRMEIDNLGSLQTKIVKRK